MRNKNALRYQRGELVNVEIWGCNQGSQRERGKAMLTTVRTEEEAAKLSRRTLLKIGWYDAEITEAIDKVAKSENDCIELTVKVGDRTFRDWLSDAGRASAKLRHCCQACGDDVFERYEAGAVGQGDFPGHAVQVKIGVQKGNRAFPGDKNVIEDYRAPADSRVVNLRTA
jgi:hypothetical protein